MLHRYASETSAALIWLTFLVLSLVATFAFPQRWRSLSSFEVLIGLLSCCYGARQVAKGKSCAWPRGVDFTGRVALVTGASSGVGFACAEELAQHGFTVIMAGRDLDRLLKARQQIMQKLPNPTKHRSRGKQNGASSSGRVVVLGKVDLSDENSIREYAATVTAAAKTYPVALLINAAGILNRELRYTKSNWPVDAGSATDTAAPKEAVCPTSKEPCTWPLEEMLATNAVGPMLLTQLLLPVLKQTAITSGVTSRIVNVASSCHTFLGPALSSDAFDPIQMIQGLEKSDVDVAVTEKHAVPSTTAEGAAPQRPVVEPQYRVGQFTWKSFVGYYGLSKLCVIWNTRLLARQVASMTFHQAQKERPVGKEGGSSSSPAVSSSGSGATRGEQLIFVACTHPGVITTHLYRDLLPLWVLDRVLYLPSLLVGKTWREAAQSTLKASVEDAHMVQAGYYLDGGEYGEESGVNCLSAHASNGAEMTRYGEWLRQKIVDTTPRPYTAVSAKELSPSNTPVKNKKETS